MKKKALELVKEQQLIEFNHETERNMDKKAVIKLFLYEKRRLFAEDQHFKFAGLAAQDKVDGVGSAKEFSIEDAKEIILRKTEAASIISKAESSVKDPVAAEAKAAAKKVSKRDRESALHGVALKTPAAKMHKWDSLKIYAELKDNPSTLIAFICDAYVDLALREAAAREKADKEREEAEKTKEKAERMNEFRKRLEENGGINDKSMSSLGV